jgi:hypothetical protein
VAACLVVALLGGLALGDDSSTPTQADKDERDNAARVPLKGSTTTRPRPTTTTTSTILAPVVPILRGSGVRLVLSRGGGNAELLDLETGTATDINLGSSDVYSVIPVRGGIVAVEGGSAVFVPLPDGENVPLGRADQVLPSGDPESVWVVLPAGDPYTMSSEAKLVSLGGEVLAGPIGPDSGYIVGASSGGLIAQAGGRIYLVDARGRTRPIVAGDVLGVSDRRLLARTCDDHAVCSLTVWDANLANPQVVDAPENASMYYGSTVVVEPGGTRAALLSYGPHGTELSIVDLAGGTAQSVDLSGDASSVAWLPGDLGLVVAQQSRLTRVRFEGGQVVNEVLRDRGADFVAVIP